MSSDGSANTVKDVVTEFRKRQLCKVNAKHISVTNPTHPNIKTPNEREDQTSRFNLVCLLLRWRNKLSLWSIFRFNHKC